jgi:hypothetical protein|tara:strand:- start:191 stop:412 length:222 start_codon:yes stop_codon:yes gene_type:complete
MAITKASGTCISMRVAGDGTVVAEVSWVYSDDATDPATLSDRQKADITITNATTAEKTAAASLAGKAAALAVS